MTAGPPQDAAIPLPGIASVLGALIAAAGYGANRFRLQVGAELAVTGDSIRITLHNKGRLRGAAHRLDVLDAGYERIELEGAGDDFESVALESHSTRVLVYTAPSGRDFRHDDTVVVGWGRKETRKQPLPVRVGFWPPGAPAGALVHRE
jgi:hypothetical protein